MIERMNEIYYEKDTSQENKDVIREYIKNIESDVTFSDPKAERYRSIYNFIYQRQSKWEKASKAKSDLLN